MNEKQQISKKDDITSENHISKFFEQLRSRIKDEGLWHIVSVSALVIFSGGAGLIGTIGLNLLSNIIDRVIKGEDVPDADIDEMTSKITQADLDQLLSKNEFWKAIAQLARRLDMMGLVIKQDNLDLKNQLSNQYQQYHQSLSEIKDYFWGSLRIESAMSDRLGRLETQQNFLLQKIMIILGDTQVLESEYDFKRKITGFSVMTGYLPYLRNPLRGRDEVVNTLNQLLADVQGVIQLIGIGGLGKSRLVAEIALNYPYGAVWHRCSSVTKDYDVVMSLRTHVNLPDDTSLEVVLEKIATRKSLIVIDNAEDVTATHREGYIALCNQLANHGVPILFTSREKWDKLTSKSYHLKPFTERDIEILMQMTHDFYAQFGKKFTDDEAQQLAKSGRFHPKLIEFAVGQIGGADYSHATIVRRLDELTHPEVQGALYEMITKTLQQMRDVAQYGNKAYDLIHNLTWLQATFPKEAIIALKPPSIATDDDDDLEDALATLKRYQFIRNADRDGRYQLAELVRETIGTNLDVFNAYADFYIQRAEDIFVKLQDNPELWGDQEGGKIFDDIVNIKALGNLLALQTSDGNLKDPQRALRFVLRTKSYITHRMENRTWWWLDMGLSALGFLRQINGDSYELMKGQSILLHEKGVVDSHFGKTDSAFNYYDKALRICRTIGYKEGEAITLNNIGRLYDKLRNKQEALKHYLKAFEIFIVINNQRNLPGIINNITLILPDLGNNYSKESILDTLQYALTITRETGYRQGEALILNSMATVYDNFGDEQQALDYYLKALSIVSDKKFEAIICNNIGGWYRKHKQLDKAFEYVEKSLELFISVSAYPYIVDQLANIAVLLDEMGRLDEAFGRANEALTIMRQRHLSYTGTGQTFIEIERIYLYLKRKRDNQQLPFETLDNWIKQVREAKTTHPDTLMACIDQFSVIKTQMSNMGDNWVKELAFVEALLAVLRGEKPVLAHDNPYADAVKQLVNALN